jgi:hypothetical protein
VLLFASLHLHELMNFSSSYVTCVLNKLNVHLHKNLTQAEQIQLQRLAHNLRWRRRRTREFRFSPCGASDNHKTTNEIIIAGNRLQFSHTRVSRPKLLLGI